MEGGVASSGRALAAGAGQEDRGSKGLNKRWLGRV
jgi:hypothetical protein